MATPLSSALFEHYLPAWLIGFWKTPNTTAKELIAKLSSVLEARDGEDLELILDVDFQRKHYISRITAMEDLSSSPDQVVISSFEAEEEYKKRNAGISCTYEQAQLN